MRRPKKDIQLTSYDELLGLEETPEKSMNQVVEIDLAKLYPFKNHPFHVNDDEKMAETVESIKTYGVLTPALVRPRPDGGYEMISGHRRKRGCELCGKTTLPALVRNYTDDEADRHNHKQHNNRHTHDSFPPSLYSLNAFLILIQVLTMISASIYINGAKTTVYGSFRTPVTIFFPTMDWKHGTKQITSRIKRNVL